MQIKTFYSIIFSSDKPKAVKMYKDLFLLEPVLDVPGMTEFCLGTDMIFGIMPVDGIKRLLKIENKVFTPGGIKSELYLIVDNPQEYIDRGIESGFRLISSLQLRDWGDLAGYIEDIDGNIIAFAKKEV